MRRVQPDLVDQPLEAAEHGFVRRKAGVEVDLVVRAEVLLESPAVFHHPVEFDQRFAAGDPGPQSAHALRHFDGLGRRRDFPFICKHYVPAFPLIRERAVPAGAVTPAGHEEDHLCSLVAEDASRREEPSAGGYSRLLWHTVTFMGRLR
jgi:hypothetical protein